MVAGLLEGMDGPNKLWEIRDDIWKYHDAGNYIVVPTNGDVKVTGEAVMGRGLARETAVRYSQFPLMLGLRLKAEGNRVLVFIDRRIITFPVKHHWDETAEVDLIEQSTKELVGLTRLITKFPIYVPKVGCGNGRLSWEDAVKPVLERYLDGRFVICDRV